MELDVYERALVAAVRDVAEQLLLELLARPERSKR